MRLQRACEKYFVVFMKILWVMTQATLRMEGMLNSCKQNWAAVESQMNAALSDVYRLWNRRKTGSLQGW
jgi:hypothetical protein